VIVDDAMFTPLPAAASETVAALESVELATGAVTPQVRLETPDGSKGLTGMAAVDQGEFARVWGFEWVGGASDDVLSRLRRHRRREQEFAARRGFAVGDTLTVTAQNGRTAQVEVIALYRDPMLFNSFTVGQHVLEELGVPADPQLTLIAAADGVSPRSCRRRSRRRSSGSPRTSRGLRPSTSTT
jgi:hypothetical protein